MSDSLLTPPDGDLSLPGFPARPFFESLEARGEFTGERLWTQRPDTYKSIVVLLGQGIGVIRIGKLLQVSPNTVMAVRKREGATIDLVKEHLANVAHDGATLASEAILAALNAHAERAHMLDIKDLKDLAVVYGILVQNGQLLAGQPTARVELSEVQKPAPHEDFNRYIAGLPRAAATDLTVEISAQKEAGAAADATSDTDVRTEPLTDLQSDGDADKPQQNQGQS